MYIHFNFFPSSPGFPRLSRPGGGKVCLIMWPLGQPITVVTWLGKPCHPLDLIETRNCRTVSVLPAQKSLLPMDTYVPHVDVKAHPICRRTYALCGWQLVKKHVFVYSLYEHWGSQMTSYLWTLWFRYIRNNIIHTEQQRKVNAWKLH